MLTKVSRDKDVVDTALSSGIIMWVVWGQNGSLRSREVTSTGSYKDQKTSNKEPKLTNVKTTMF